VTCSAAGQATAEQFAATFDSPTRATAEVAAATAQEALLVHAGAGELYARLLCEFEPAAVLPFLQAHAAYRVELVLPHTQRFGVDDAQARRALLQLSSPNCCSVILKFSPQ